MKKLILKMVGALAVAVLIFYLVVLITGWI